MAIDYEFLNRHNAEKASSKAIEAVSNSENISVVYHVNDSSKNSQIKPEIIYGLIIVGFIVLYYLVLRSKNKPEN